MNLHEVAATLGLERAEERRVRICHFFIGGLAAPSGGATAALVSPPASRNAAEKLFPASNDERRDIVDRESVTMMFGWLGYFW